MYRRSGLMRYKEPKSITVSSLFVHIGERQIIFFEEAKGSETMTAFAEDLKEHNGHPMRLQISPSIFPPLLSKGLKKTY
ncbi:MAG: hypothetical protein KBG82_06295 [Spirochaetes bacterium]|nr:hypothetical protein [Spirochaetota bacterium]HNV44115.1 hypothetical protein [Exilispira sp.]